MSNAVVEALRGHRSIRRYRPDPVPEEMIDEILEAGIRASSSGNMQSYSIIVTRDPVLRERLYEPHMRRWLALSEAPDNFDNFVSFMIAAIDAVLVSQNVAMAAESHGLGICYMAIPELRERVEAAGVENLAQLYTTVKHTRQSHALFSTQLLRTLRERGFLKEDGS